MYICASAHACQQYGSLMCFQQFQNHNGALWLHGYDDNGALTLCLCVNIMCHFSSVVCAEYIFYHFIIFAWIVFTGNIFSSAESVCMYSRLHACGWQLIVFSDSCASFLFSACQATLAHSQAPFTPGQDGQCCLLKQVYHVSDCLFLSFSLCLSMFKMSTCIAVLFVEVCGNVWLYCIELYSIWQRGDLGSKAGL